MRSSTAYNHLRRLQGHLDEIYSLARISGSSHKEINERINARVWADEGLSRCPSWVKMELMVRRSIHAEQIYTAILYASQVDALEYGNGKPPAFVRWQLRVDGEFVTSNEISRMRNNGDETVWERVEGAHIWNHRKDRCYSSWQNTYTHKEV